MNRRAVDLPIPFEAPVIKATRDEGFEADDDIQALPSDLVDNLHHGAWATSCQGSF
jgi:hypothetical protein